MILAQIFEHVIEKRAEPVAFVRPRNGLRNGLRLATVAMGGNDQSSRHRVRRLCAKVVADEAKAEIVGSHLAVRLWNE